MSYLTYFNFCLLVKKYSKSAPHINSLCSKNVSLYSQFRSHTAVAAAVAAANRTCNKIEKLGSDLHSTLLLRRQLLQKECIYIYMYIVQQNKKVRFRSAQHFAAAAAAAVVKSTCNNKQRRCFAMHLKLNCLVKMLASLLMHLLKQARYCIRSSTCSNAFA